MTPLCRKTRTSEYWMWFATWMTTAWKICILNWTSRRQLFWTSTSTLHTITLTSRTHVSTRIYILTLLYLYQRPKLWFNSQSWSRIRHGHLHPGHTFHHLPPDGVPGQGRLDLIFLSKTDAFRSKFLKPSKKNTKNVKISILINFFFNYILWYTGLVHFWRGKLNKGFS